MARMIPTELRPGAPRSERLVFKQLREGPAEWVVLCSVEVPVLDGDPKEIDFLIMIPDQAVICLEVKGDSSYRVRDGVWFSGRRRVNQLPFDQARDEMYALRDYLKSEFPTDNEICYVPLDFAVMFTNTVWPQGAKKPPTRQFFDSSVLQTDGELVNRLNRFARQIGRRGNRSKPTPIVLDRIRQRLMPDLAMQYAWVLGPDLGRIDRELLELTSEQFACLKLVQDDNGNIRNPRVLFTGGAGTGKTILAMQLAKDRLQAGDKVALICHSPVLGNRIRDQLPGEVDAGNIRAVVHDNRSVPTQLSRRFDRTMAQATNPAQEREIFYRFGVEAIASLEEQWDFLIIDELQYFFSQSWLNLIDLGLKGGLNNGSWAMFADFENQNWGVEASLAVGRRDGWDIGDYLDAKDILTSICHNGWVKAPPLTINCRNSANIAKEAALLAGKETGNLLNTAVEGPNVVYDFFSDDEEMLQILDRHAALLSQEHVPAGKISVVSTHRPDSLHGSQCGPWRLWPRSFDREFYPPDNRWLSTYPVHMFAGMESDVIIALIPGGIPAGFEGQENVFIDILHQQIYVAMTRAKGKLIIVAHGSYKDLLDASND